MNSTILILMILGVFGTMAIIAAALNRRKKNSYELIVVQDNRRGTAMTAGKYHYNLRVGNANKLKALKIYNGLISFTPVRVLTEMSDPRPFVWYGRTCFGILGPTGQVEDDTIVMVPKPKFTSLDIERFATTQKDNIRHAFQPFLAGLNGSMLKDQESMREAIGNYINKTFNESWVLRSEGAADFFIKKDDVLPRSLKVAYVNEIEHSYSLEAKHQDTWSKFLQYAPFLVLSIFIIAVGVSLYMILQQNGANIAQQQAYGQQMYVWSQAQSLAIGKALAAVGVYGYNVSLAPPPGRPANASLIPSITLPK